MRLRAAVYTPEVNGAVLNDFITDKAKKLNCTFHILDKWIFEFCQYHAKLQWKKQHWILTEGDSMQHLISDSLDEEDGVVTPHQGDDHSPYR